MMTNKQHDRLNFLVSQPLFDLAPGEVQEMIALSKLSVANGPDNRDKVKMEKLSVEVSLVNG